ncbi:hypothetical protein Avbf_01172 [Armadillidium vulgare]|nr:hypothetical protein Avbf_01172 [Armadillidium vulgare]
MREEKILKNDEKFETEMESETGVILKCSYLHPVFGLRKEFCDHHIKGGAICVQKLKFKRPHEVACPTSIERPWILLKAEEGNVSSITALKYCPHQNSVMELECDVEVGWESDRCISNLPTLKTKINIKRHARNPPPIFNKRKTHSVKRRKPNHFTSSQRNINRQKKNRSRRKHDMLRRNFETSSRIKNISPSEFFHGKHGGVTFDQKHFEESRRGKKIVLY